MNQVQVTRKELSNGLTAILVTLDDQEGITIDEMVRVFGIARKTIEDHLQSRGFETRRVSAKFRTNLQVVGIAGLRGPMPKLIPRAGVESVVRFISTPETDAIYKQLWEVVNNVYNGNVVQAMADTGVVPKDAREYLRMALAELDKAVEENDRLKGTITNIDKAPLEYAVPKALRAKDIIIEFPALNDYAQRWFKQKFIRNQAKLKVFSLDTARLTYFLKARHQISANIVAAEVVKNPSKKGELCTRALYDRTTIANLAKEYEKATA